MNKRALVMTISLNALEHLGINLYSNIPAVLSEIVANAWDADAHIVKVTIDKSEEKITIEDNGIGMNRDAVIDRFLTVGYKKRDDIGDVTDEGRKPMGRKGIGKLSIFSIAGLAEVYTTHKGERTAFRMDREIIKQAIAGKGQANYEPEELTDWPSDLQKGTRIVLSGLSKSLSGMTVEGLKRRVARRFSVIGPKHNFVVNVNGDDIGPEDRGYQNSLQYIWTYGDQVELINMCKNLSRPAEARISAISDELTAAGLTISGWIGTVTKPEKLKDDDGDNLNRLAVFMRGKMAQEDILDGFGQKEIYADYVIGELHCEELDLDDQGDIATSSRQSLKEDDPRFSAVRRIVLSELRYIASKWSDWRRADGAKAAASVPAVSNWLNALKGDTKKKAERWIGRLNTIRANDDADKKELLKASILAFESYRRKDDLDRLDKLSDQSVGELLPIFESIDELEVSYYGQIVQGRVKVIETLQNKVADNEKEKLLQNYIYEHLWLLDPSWERAKGSEHVEGLVEKFLKQNSDNLSAAEKAGRIDIGYRTASGKHVIIEMKRASVSTPLDDLVKQVRKYRDGARKILAQTDMKAWPIEIVCLVGMPPPEYHDVDGTGPAGVAEALLNVNARIVFYDQLLDNAQKAYADYLEAHKQVDNLWGVFNAIDDFTAPS